MLLLHYYNTAKSYRVPFQTSGYQFSSICWWAHDQVNSPKHYIRGWKCNNHNNNNDNNVNNNNDNNNIYCSTWDDWWALISNKRFFRCGITFISAKRPQNFSRSTIRTVQHLISLSDGTQGKLAVWGPQNWSSYFHIKYGSKSNYVFHNWERISEFQVDVAETKGLPETKHSKIIES